MANKVFDALAIQQELNKVESKAEKDYVDEKVSDLNSSLEDIANELPNYAKKTTTNDLQSQINNLILESGESNPEVVQARGGYAVLNDRLNSTDKIFEDLKLQRLNLFDKTDVTLDKYFGGIIGTSTVNNIGDTTNSFISNQSFKVSKGDIIKVNQYYVGIYIYDETGLLVEKYNEETKEFTVQSDTASFFRIGYGNYADGKIDSLMLTINSTMPLEYISFNNISLKTIEIVDLLERVTSLEEDKKKSYILLSFDDQTNMYANRFSIMKDYGFKFTFCLNSGMQVNNDFATDTEKQTFYNMLAYGCDVSMYGGDRNSTPPAVADRTQEEWVTWLTPLLTTINNLGVFPTTYFAPRGEMPENGKNALKELGFSLCRCGLYNCENNYRWVESWSEDRFGIPMVQIQDDNLDTVKTYIDNCITNGWSLSIFTHQVVDSNTSDLNCDTTVFKSLLDYIKVKVDSGDCEVVTFQEFLNKNTEKGRDIQHMRDTRRMNYIENKIASL